MNFEGHIQIIAPLDSGFENHNFCDVSIACKSEFASQVVQSVSLLELTVHSGIAI